MQKNNYRKDDFIVNFSSLKSVINQIVELKNELNEFKDNYIQEDMFINSQGQSVNEFLEILKTIHQTADKLNVLFTKSIEYLNLIQKSFYENDKL